MRVRIEVKSERADNGEMCWWATSPDMPQWIATDNSLDGLKAMCVEALDVVLERPDATIEYEYAPAVA